MARYHISTGFLANSYSSPNHNLKKRKKNQLNFSYKTKQNYFNVPFIRFYITHFPISSLLVLRKVTTITIIVANIYRVQWVRRWSTHLTTYLTHICIISLNPQAISLLFTEEATAGERLSVMLKVTAC